MSVHSSLPCLTSCIFTATFRRFNPNYQYPDSVLSETATDQSNDHDQNPMGAVMPPLYPPHPGMGGRNDRNRAASAEDFSNGSKQYFAFSYQTRFLS